ncbi:MAG: YbgC/FadM family acyl-CoA thioesterase [Deltaproteobacteria bacterium]|nr:YbgC/FadM family acyl-CoA thioesterase [Deltaproteobacteria bacterium]
MTEIRICFADTDAGGVVYYGHYLRFLEQGRTEFLRDRGLSVRELHDKGSFLPVIHLEIDYRAPALLDDLVRVETALLETAGATFTLSQKVIRSADGKLLVDAKLTLACIGPDGRPRRLPPALVEALQKPEPDRK